MLAFVLSRWDLYTHNYTFWGTFIGIPVFVILLSICILKLVSLDMRMKFSLLVGSIVFANLLIESYLNFYGNTDIRVIKALSSGVVFDMRSRKQVIKDLRKKGSLVYPTIHPSLSLKKSDSKDLHSSHSVNNREILPLGGISSVSTVHNRESGNHLIYESDEHGFRNPAGTWELDSFDIGVVGDSFAHGAGLPDGNDYVSLLRQYFPNSINLAYDDNGPLLAFATVHEYFSILKPRYVIYFYYEGNDLNNLNREKRSPLLMRYLNEESWSQDLFAKQDAIDAALKDFAEQEIRKNNVSHVNTFRKIFTLSNLRQRIGLISGHEDPKLQPDFVLFESIIQRNRDEVKAWGGTFVLVYLPSWKRYGDPDDFHVYRKEVLAIMKKNSVPIVDLHPVFQKHADVFSLFHFGLRGHYNQVGAKLVVNEVRKALESLSQ